jgi:flagellar hook-basal body complex protein FliE
MAIPLVGPAASAALTSLQQASSAASTAASSAAETNSSFGDMVSQGIQSLDATQQSADKLALQAATGDLSDMHDYLIAATKASLATDLTVAVRNKAVDSFNEIMRMQI